MNIVVLTAGAVGSLALAVYFIWRGIFQGILAKRIVVKGTPFTGGAAVTWVSSPSCIHSCVWRLLSLRFSRSRTSYGADRQSQARRC
jgi:hypothetical protein